LLLSLGKLETMMKREGNKASEVFMEYANRTLIKRFLIKYSCVANSEAVA
jgi:hypothetical protein